MGSKKGDEKSVAQLAQEYEQLREELARRGEELRRRKAQEQEAWVEALAQSVMRVERH